MAGRDKERYAKEIAKYTPPEESESEGSDDNGRKKKKRKKKADKDPNKPKRSMSSFMFFANEKRKEVKDKEPLLKMTEIGKKLAEMWKELSASEKKVLNFTADCIYRFQKYEDMAKQDKERYTAAMGTYKPPEKKEQSSSSDSDSSSSSDSE